MHIPRETIGYVTGNRGEHLRQVEQETYAAAQAPFFARVHDFH